MKLLRWFSWLNREKFLLLVASIALTKGAIHSWYRLPPQSLEAFGTNLALVDLGRLLAALLAFVGFASILWPRLIKFLRLPFWVGLIAVLLFPYFITTWSPTINFLATTYSQQLEKVDQHVMKNFSQIQSQWKQNIDLYPTTPTTSIFNFSIKDSRFFQISSWDRFIIEGLGYDNKFLEFISQGWLLTLIGLGISLLAFYLERESHVLNILIADICKLLPWLGLLTLFLLLSLLLPNFIDHQLETKMTKGEYHQVVITSHNLLSLYPPLKGDTAFVQRLAKAGFYGNEPEPALVYFTQGLELYNQGDYLQAEDYFQRSLNIEPRSFLVRGYLAATIINQGVKYFNNYNAHNTFNEPKPGQAADRFEQALQIFPGHIEALYYLMLARVANGEFQKSAMVAQQLIDTQKYPQQAHLALLGQAYLHLSWASFQNSDITQAWKQYRQSVDTSTWSKSDEADK